MYTSNQKEPSRQKRYKNLIPKITMFSSSFSMSTKHNGDRFMTSCTHRKCVQLSWMTFNRDEDQHWITDCWVCGGAV